MKKAVSASLTFIILVLLLSICIFAEETQLPSEENVLFTYDFAHVSDFKAEFGITQDNQIEYAPADGYTTFTATGDDPYFRIGSGAQGDSYYPTQKCTELTYIVIRYRTTAKISMGEIFVNHGGQTWGADGTHLEYKFKNDGEWHNLIVDATSVWGGAIDQTLYAIRLDPLYSGCKSGDTIDIQYIKFFGSYADAYEYATGEKYEESTTVPKQMIKCEFYVNDHFVNAVEHPVGEWGAEYEPVVPAIPGKIGSWEYDYGYPGQGDITHKAHAVYTDISPDTNVEPDPDVTEPYYKDIQTEAEITAQTADVTTGSETVAATGNNGCGGYVGCFAAVLMIGFGFAVSKRCR